MWNLLLEIDPDELFAARERQKMQLARYAKQSLLQWDDVEVVEIRRWIVRLDEVLAAETDAQRATED